MGLMAFCRIPNSYVLMFGHEQEENINQKRFMNVMRAGMGKAGLMEEEAEDMKRWKRITLCGNP